MARPFGSKNSYFAPRQRGASAANWKGGRVVTPYGYVLVFVGGQKRYTFEHELIAEQALGHPLPASAVIHHVNEIKTDNRGANLVMCQDDAYHVELHRKLRVLRAGGDPWRDRLCCTCRMPRPAPLFYRQRTKEKAFNPAGYTSICGDCARECARRRRKRAA
jgi:hypothetical protein